MARNKAFSTYPQEIQNEGTTQVLRGKASARQMSPKPTYEEVQARAYQIFLARGNGPGTAEEDWFHAEQELASSDEGSRDE